jgi:hypothetical protein
MQDQTPTPIVNSQTPPASSGNTTAAASFAPTNTPPPAAITPPLNGAPTVDSNATPPATASWRDSLPEELKAEKSIANYKSIEDLARGFVSAQKMIGHDKIVVPDLKTASDEDMQNVYKKLGLPEDVKEYKLDLAPDSGLDTDFLEKIKGEAHKIGILPKQLEKILGWYSGESKEVMKAHFAKTQADHEKSHNDLRTEWGKAYDKNVLAAQLAVKDGASPEEIKYLESKGLTTDATLVRIFSKLGNMLKEGELKGDGSGGMNMLPPAAAQAEANKIMGDANHPYNKAGHVNHKMAVDEVARLMSMAYPEQPKE